MLRIHRMFHSLPAPNYYQLQHPDRRLHQLVLSSPGRTDVQQQLHQPVHLRRQVPRVSAGRQTSAVEDENESTAVSSFSNHLKYAYYSRLPLVCGHFTKAQFPAVRKIERSKVKVTQSRYRFSFVCSWRYDSGTIAAGRRKFNVWCAFSRW